MAFWIRRLAPGLLVLCAIQTPCAANEAQAWDNSPAGIANIPTSRVPAVDDSLVRLSPGDRLGLQWWGLSRGSLPLMVDNRWELAVPDVGIFSVRNTTLDKVRVRIEAAIRARVRVDAVTLQVLEFAPAEVHLAGLGVKSGLRRIPAGTRLSQFLASEMLDEQHVLGWKSDAAPPNRGDMVSRPSMRDIEIARGDSQSIHCDLAKAIFSADRSQDPPLFTGDRIRIVPQTSFLAITGNPIRQGYVEHVPGETARSFLASVGALAYRGPINCRVGDGIRRMELDAPIDSACQALSLDERSFDELPRLVWVSGLVKNPGGYDLKPGMTARDLVREAGGIPGGDDQGELVTIRKGWLWNQAGKGDGRLESGTETASNYPEVKVLMTQYATRMRGNYSSVDVPLNEGDSVKVVRSEKVVWVGGQVARPGYVTWKKGNTIDDYVAAAGGYSLRPWKSRTKVFDLYTNQERGLDQEIRPGFAILVPERTYTPPIQWVTVVLSLASTALTILVLTIQLAGN